MKVFYLLIALTPCLAHAGDIWCRGPTGWEQVEAQSLEQARYAAQQRWHQQVSCVKGDPKDVFNSDIWWARRQHLRPFLPTDIQRPQIERSKRQGALREDFACDANGDFAADGSGELTRCSRLTSASMGAWKIRMTPGDHTWLWRLPNSRLDGAAQFWVEIAPGGVDHVSPEAKAYAESRGFKVNATTGKSGFQAPIGNSDSGAPNAAREVRDCGKLSNFLEKVKCFAEQSIPQK